MSIASPASVLTSRVVVATVALRTPPTSRVLAFAIDSPQPGDRVRGGGLEVNGWVLLREESAQGVRAVRDGVPGRLAALDVRRPDVAADYPHAPRAAWSGFSAWMPLGDDSQPWSFTIEAVLHDGEAVPLADVHGHMATEHWHRDESCRPVMGPDFVIIGAQRGGTTSLYAYLSSHPHVRPAATKELHFLTDRYERGLEWYRAQFPLELPPGTIIGEATPYALFHPLAPRRLRQTAPSAKVIVLLRDPATRAHSHYLLERSRDIEPLAFADALDAEPIRLAGEEERLAVDPENVSAAHKHFSYQARGDYARQLARWLSQFPREQIQILRSEDLYGDTDRTFARVTEFLGIDQAADIPFEKHNHIAGPRLEHDVRLRLNDRFASENAKLASLLGWDPGWPSP